MKRMNPYLIGLLLVGCSTCAAQEDQEARVRSLLEQADRELRNDESTWARFLMQADNEAKLLERRAPPEFGQRTLEVKAGLSTWRLTFIWNGIQQQENYNHDLLQHLVTTRRGTPIGADALITMLHLGTQEPWWRGINAMAPVLHRHVIAVIESGTWQKLHDPRLARIAAEAYETWWSLSQSKPDDYSVADTGATAADFLEGAEEARMKAIGLYEQILKLQPDDSDLARRVADLRSRVDTGQRAWFQGGD